MSKIRWVSPIKINCHGIVTIKAKKNPDLKDRVIEWRLGIAYCGDSWAVSFLPLASATTMLRS